MWLGLACAIALSLATHAHAQTARPQLGATELESEPTSATDARARALRQAAEQGEESPPSASTPSDSAVVRDEVPAFIAPAQALQTPTMHSTQRFGKRGIVITTDPYLWLGSTTWSGSQAFKTRADLVAGFDLFTGGGVSLGVDLELQYHDDALYGADNGLVETKARSVSGGPRVGLAIPLSRMLSLYPRLTLGVHYVNAQATIREGASYSTGTANGSPSFVVAGPWVSLYVPLLLHLTPDLFVGFGPRLYHDFAPPIRGPELGTHLTQLGFQLELGTVVGADATAPELATASVASNFSRAGNLVLSGDLNLNGSWSFRSGHDGPSEKGLSIAPGCDYFFTDHVSFGGAIAYSTEHALRYDESNRIDDISHSLAVHARIGVDLTLGTWLSLYTRLALGLGFGGYDEGASPRDPGLNVSSNSAVAFPHNSATVQFTNAAVDSLVLAHLAPHVFVGLGPLLYHDLSRTYFHGNSHGENRATQIGLESIVGGWI